MTPTSTATIPSVTPTVPSSCSTSGNSGFESTLIDLINQERADQGLDPLSRKSALTAAARSHSEDMACNDFMSHTGSDGSRPADRVAAQGYSFSWIGENIYAGNGSYNSPNQAFNWWMDSAPHRANLLNTNYQSIGIGYIFSSDSQYGGYFTAVFTRP
ncbi:MAG: CAP domain-containing protein [Anaerolineales bacterium]|nr:CAP domain-containing protein [Anaerolineales bacterium]